MSPVLEYIGDDALKALRNVPAKYGIHLPDRQLACAPVDSPEGQEYLGAMRAAANYAFCNRQLLTWQVREVFARAVTKLGLHLHDRTEVCGRPNCNPT